MSHDSFASAGGGFDPSIDGANRDISGRVRSLFPVCTAGKKIIMKKCTLQGKKALSKQNAKKNAFAYLAPPTLTAGIRYGELWAQIIYAEGVGYPPCFSSGYGGPAGGGAREVLASTSAASSPAPAVAGCGISSSSVSSTSARYLTVADLQHPERHPSVPA